MVEPRPENAKTNEFLVSIDKAHESSTVILQESEARYRSVVEGSLQAIVIHQHDVIQYANPACAHLFGYMTPAALIGRSLWEMVAPEAVPVIQEYLAIHLRGETAPDPQEWQGRRQDGTLLWCESTGHSLVWDGSPALVTFITDISEYKRLTDHLRQAEKMQAVGTLAGGIAHEFNNILSIILGFADLTQYEVPQGSISWSHMQEILTAGRRAKNLVQQLLAFSRQSEPARTPVAFHLLLKETLLLLRASLPATIDIRQEVDQEVGVVLADAPQIHQIIMHLCSNAEYAMRDTGGVLEIRLEAVEITRHFALEHPPLRPGPHVCLTVRDTGHGMPPEVLERIFEPFFTTKGVGEGTGMSLAIVHGIVANHRGAITVDSVPGQGTTCSIYLPCVQNDIDGDKAELDSMAHKPQVLFVDDEEMIARLGQAMLKRLGYDAVTATSGDEALQVFQSAPQRFDLVITDQTMPRLTGANLAQALRQIRADIPIILCTGFSHMMNAGKAQDIGIDAFCMKPLTLQDLERAIQQVLGTCVKTR